MRYIRTIHASQTLRRVVLITDATTGRRHLHQLTVRQVLCKHVQRDVSFLRSTVHKNQAMEHVLLFKPHADVKELLY